MNLIEQTRQQADALFNQLGLPSKRDEHWKYTDVSAWADALQAEPTSSNIKAENLGIADLDVYRLVFINGVFDGTSSNLPHDIDILPMSEFLSTHEGQALEAYARLFDVQADAPLMNGFEAYNAAHATDGAAVCLAANSKLDKPLYILHINNQNNIVRHGFILGEHAEAEIIEHFIGTDAQRGLSNMASHIILQDGAQLQHYRLQQESSKQAHIARVDVKQHQHSTYTLHAVELGGALSRVDVLVNLAEQGASCALHGLFVLSGRQHVDHHTRVDHTAPHCTSNETYRTVLDGRSHAVFNGKIMVHKDAIKTDSSMSNGNILLSKHAEIDTKPELEIYNDDVLCAHGATVGQLDDKQLFYMRSRGISQEAAQELLTFAFADEVLAAMNNDVVRRYVEQAAFAKLPHNEDIEGMLTT
ncbi:MAG: Fe-S cluster assembly protein SufD [Mariprofundaceae bacterium]|nr:Fe-S cluster assembly protein SufD [Mariprofundaceae bacterium]